MRFEKRLKEIEEKSARIGSRKKAFAIMEKIAAKNEPGADREDVPDLLVQLFEHNQKTAKTSGKVLRG